MDWYLEAGDRTGATVIRREFTDYLQRHGAESAAVDMSVLAFTELVNNGVEHAEGPLWIEVDWSGVHPIVSVNDLGPSFELSGVSMPDPGAIRGRGLAIAADVAAHLEVERKAGGGSRVEAELTVERRSQTDFDPPRRTRNVLPDVSEAGPDGFGRDAFLRALVVQMAQVVERSAGPIVAESVIAQVGSDVGGQMETEFRTSHPGLATLLKSSEIAECFVRLKHTLGGDFYVVEADENRIVLANRACPFGEAVMRAPALCRMTSSVFGGIAARSFGEATVVLEERIAVGDPQCRVSIYLGEQPDRPHGHRYLAPVDF